MSGARASAEVHKESNRSSVYSTTVVSEVVLAMKGGTDDDTRMMPVKPPGSSAALSAEDPVPVNTGSRVMTLDLSSRGVDGARKVNASASEGRVTAVALPLGPGGGQRGPARLDCTPSNMVAELCLPVAQDRSVSAADPGGGQGGYGTGIMRTAGPPSGQLQAPSGQPPLQRGIDVSAGLRETDSEELDKVLLAAYSRWASHAIRT